MASFPRAHAVSVVELSSSNGSTICPNFLSGFGQAKWNLTTSTCTLQTTSPASPTLCIRGTTGGCVLFAIDVLQIDLGVTFSINTIMGGVAVYSTLNNYGVISANDIGITNYGTINNWGTIHNGPSSNILNLPFTGQGIINNYSGAAIVNYGIISNQGTVNNSGTISNYCPGMIEQNPILGNPVQNHSCAPVAPKITTPSGSIFPTLTPTITGISQTNVTIILFDGTISVGTTTALTGNWSITTSPLTMGFHNLTATATNSLGSSPPSQSVAIFVSGPPDFGISANLTALTIREETSGKFTITLRSLNGFAGNIALSATVNLVIKKGLVAGLSPISLTLAANGQGISTLNVSAGGPTPQGTYTVTVTGVSGTLTHQVRVIVTVIAG